MKKLFFYSAVIAAAIASGCSEPTEQNYSPDPETVKDFDAIARIGSTEELRELLNNSNGKLTRAEAGSSVDFDDNFVSMMDVCEVVDDEPVTYYDMKEFEELVPNTDFALLLNSKGEIHIGDMMYRITPAGTYRFAPALRSKVDSMIDELDRTEGTTVAEWTVELADGIMRYNTFEQSKEIIEDRAPDLYMPAPQWDGASSYGSYYGGVDHQGAATRARVNPINYPTYFVDAHTVFGEIFEGIFGRNKAYTVKLSENRRLKGKLYYYNYFGFDEMGVTAKYQKDQWIGWSNTEADMINIFWINVMIEYPLPAPNPSIPAPSYSTPTVLGSYTSDIGKVLVIGGIDPSKNQALQDAVESPDLGRILDYLNNALGTAARAPFHDAFLFIHGRKAYSLTCGGDYKYNVEKLNKTFNSSMNFEIKIPSDPGNALAWFKAISGSVSGSKMHAAICGVEAFDGPNNNGINLIKQFEF